MELSTQDLLQAIIEEYHKVFQEIKDGTLTEIPTGENKTKQVFFMKNGNWGLSSGTLRKDGHRKGDTTTVYRLKKIAKFGLFSEDDFKNYKGDLHKEIGSNDTDAKYIMIYLHNRVTNRQTDNGVVNRDFGYEDDEIATEGARMQVVVNRYERDRTIREKVLAKRKGNYSCEVCGFNFKSVYGDLGKDFIHVHHRMPLYKIGKSYHPNTDTDFALVCPNCHAMLHRNREEPLLPEDLRGIIVKQN